MKRKRTYIFLITLILVPLSALSQVEPMLKSRDFPEVLVLSKGTTMEDYVLKKLWKNMKPLTKRVTAYEATTTAHFHLMEGWLDASFYARRNACERLGAADGAELCYFLEDNPDIELTFRQTVAMEGKKLRVKESSISCDTDKAVAYDLDKMRHRIVIDEDAFSDLYNQDMPWSMRNAHCYKFQYDGCYDEGDRKVYVLVCPGCRFDVVEGLWQIKWVKMLTASGSIQVLCEERAAGLFLPVAGENIIFSRECETPSPLICRYYTTEYGEVRM